MHRKLYVAGSSCDAAPGCCVCVLSGVQSVTPRTAPRQAPLSLGFSGPQYWNGFSFFLQGIFLTQGWNPRLLYCRRILYLRNHRGSPHLQPRLSQTRMPCDLLPATSSPVAGLTDLINVYWRGVVDRTLSQVQGHKQKPSLSLPSGSLLTGAPTVTMASCPFCHSSSRVVRGSSKLWEHRTAVQSLSCVLLFATPGTAAFQASLSIHKHQYKPPR